MRRMNVDYFLDGEPYSITVLKILDYEEGIVEGVDDTEGMAYEHLKYAMEYAPITINLKQTHILSLSADFDGRQKFIDLSNGGEENAWKKIRFFFRRFIDKRNEDIDPIKGPSSIYKETERICGAVLITSSDELDETPL